MKEQILTILENTGLFLGILVATIITAFIFNRLFRRFLRRSSSHLNNDPTNYLFLRHAITAVIYLVGISIAIYTLPNLRALANSLLAGAGILAVAVGFASQHALSNIISGIFIIVFKPFRVNDRLSVGTRNGVVEDITLRHTVIRDFENRRILVPNAVISDEVIVNADFEDSRICKWVEVGISYDSDIDLAKTIMRDIVIAHPLNIDPRTPEQIEEGAPLVPVRVISLGDSSVNLRAWAWANDQADAFALNCDVLEQIKKQFDASGIEIPFPHRTIYQKN